ncbi:hypothetical protein [Pseudomonas viridiflava]
MQLHNKLLESWKIEHGSDVVESWLSKGIALSASKVL